MTELPRGSVTFLFTDIEGSTRRWETDPDGMNVALIGHDEVLRSAIESHGGVVFKHMGDGMIAAFVGSQAAVAAAIDAQRRLELPVRMGIASGEAELRNGDYFGLPLNRASRVMAAGHGGQILVTGAVAASVRGVEFLDLGTHRLRDVPEPVRLHQVCAEGLGSAFPPLNTHGAPGNLVRQQSSFIGREAELAELTDRVRTHRLVTLTGAGGVGKTRLAVATAGALVDEFIDGVWLVELAPVRDAAAVPDLVAGTLGITPRPDVSMIDSITQVVSAKRMLIVLDNCEHVLDAAAAVATALLTRCEDVRIIVTSREGLRVKAEQLWPVPTLRVEGGSEAEAVRLFIERARAVEPSFALNGDADLENVQAICSGLDGLALAIELAAARMVSMTLYDVRRRLGDRFRLLADTGRGMEHHRTLHSAVSWSYDLLDDDERQLLNRSSVFADGFDVAAATQVCGDGYWDEYQVLDLLRSLVRKSLLTTERLAGTTRYGCLETIRQFAQQQLAASGGLETLRRRHAQYFADRVSAAWETFNTPQQRAALDFVDSDLANLRTAFLWTREHDELEWAVAIAAHAATIGIILQSFEPAAWAEELVAEAEAAGVRQLPRLLVGASVCGLMGRPSEGIAYAHRALDLEADPRYEPFQPGWANFLELVGYRYAGPIERWVEICTELCTRDGMLGVLGLTGSMAVLPGIGRAEEARALADRAVAAADALGIPWWIAYAAGGRGRAYVDVDVDEARVWMERSLAYSQEHRIVYQERVMKRDLGSLEAALGHPVDALELFDSSLAFYHRAGNHGSAATTLADVAVVLEGIGQAVAAATVYGSSVPLGTSMVSRLPEVLARLRKALGDEPFERSVAAGAAMDFDAAIRHARSEMMLAREALRSPS